MQIKSTIFRALCGLGATVLVLLVSSPITLMAFYDSDAVQPTTAYTQIESTALSVMDTLPDAVIDAYYMNENIDNLPLDAKPAYDVFTLAERQAQQLPIELPKVPPYYNQKVVCLTFDDGPDSDNTPAVLDILSSYGVKATFFVVGNQVEKYPDILNRIYQEGHAIGNHSYNHVYRDLYQSAHTYVAQLHQTDEIIKKVIDVRSRISRAPGGSAGSFTKEYWDILKRQGYVEVGWNINSGDASSTNSGRIVSNITTQMENKNLWSHAIVLMHDGRGHAETVKALPDIIKFYKERQFEFRVVNLGTPPAW